ncbi:ribonucleotide reductase of class II [Microcystis phage MaeS]|nr:ribonucleotide reductase of class II [Microcystis phage MaeS]
MYSQEQIVQLNYDIANFKEVFPIDPKEMNKHQEGVSRLVMLDRYAFKDLKKVTLKQDDLVVAKIKNDPKFPALGIAYVDHIDRVRGSVDIVVDEEFRGVLEGNAAETGKMTVSLNEVEKPLELYYEQIAKRNAYGLSRVEETPELQALWFKKFYQVLKEQDFVPAGRVMYGAGAGTDVTYFNCYVMPYPKDSREGIAEHRGKVMEIMSRGGGVGTNGSTLRPRNELARGVNGKSSGSVSWLNDIANLTNLVEQGGSRRGAQMIMLASWAPDIFEFIISKMQNPKILRFIIEVTKDEQIRKLAQDKLKFTPLKPMEIQLHKAAIFRLAKRKRLKADEAKALAHSRELIADGGTYSVHNPEFLTGANISVALTEDFMHAVEHDLDYDLRFPDVRDYNEEEMKYYNENWHHCGDVRKWEKDHGMKVRTYRTIKARDLWELINICATYSAEPGIFFIDNANEMTNAQAYGQQVVCTNPCGEQPLAPWSVCNLSAVNLAHMKKRNAEGKWEVDFDKLKETVHVGIRMQDNVISATPYFMEENTKQALGERRIGLGVMGLHDLLIYCEEVYGSDSGNAMIDEIFKEIAISAYEQSIELANEKGSFPFLTEGDEKQNRLAFINSGFMKKMPEFIRQGVMNFGIRNSHLLTVAPTGSTGTLVGVSTGLEPYFAFSYFRSGRLGKFIEVNAKILQDYLNEHPEVSKDNLPEWFVSAMDLSPEAHADVQCVIQRWVDSSISKTVNAPKGYSVKQVQAVYERLWKGGAKGGTVYVDGSRDSQVLSLTNEENSVDELDAPTKEDEKVILVDTIKPLEETTVTIGSEAGDTCPMCRQGTVREHGGCNTCDNCGAQLKCGL